MLRVVSNSVSTPASFTGNGGGWSQGEKPKRRPSHPGSSGEEKTGRMNTNKPLMRRRYSKSSQEMTVGSKPAAILGACSLLSMVQKWEGCGSLMTASGTPRPPA